MSTIVVIILSVILIAIIICIIKSIIDNNRKNKLIQIAMRGRQTKKVKIKRNKRVR